MIEVAHGRVMPGFEPVAEAFALNFIERKEVGAAFAAMQDGRTVVDLWGGVADTTSGRPWEQDTLEPRGSLLPACCC
jgi:Beta-lactamase